MRKKTQFTHPRILTTERQIVPNAPTDGDEVFCNGVFHFHISALLRWLEQSPQKTLQIPVRCWNTLYGLEEEHINAADIFRPIVIAEIAPDYRDFLPDIPEEDWLSRGYVCIDGNHRLEKARRMGLDTLPAVVLKMEQHILFMYSGYDHYVEYWNRKLEERTAASERQAKRK